MLNWSYNTGADKHARVAQLIHDIQVEIIALGRRINGMSYNYRTIPLPSDQ